MCTCDARMSPPNTLSDTSKKSIINKYIKYCLLLNTTVCNDVRCFNLPSSPRNAFKSHSCSSFCADILWMSKKIECRRRSRRSCIIVMIRDLES